MDYATAKVILIMYSIIVFMFGYLYLAVIYEIHCYIRRVKCKKFVKELNTNHDKALILAYENL